MVLHPNEGHGLQPTAGLTLFADRGELDFQENKLNLDQDLNQGSPDHGPGSNFSF